MVFGIVPAEVPVQRSLDLLAPRMQLAVHATLEELSGGPPEWIFETLRTEERQAFLYGFGREYDDGRGPVTNAAVAYRSWHFFGLALDVVEKDRTPWDAPPSFWTDLGRVAKRHGLDWGGDWKKPDLPHLQWGKCRRSPSPRALEIFRAGGFPGIWRAVGAL